MCQVHLIARVDGKNMDEVDLEELNWIVTQGGYTNGDATGLFAAGFLNKDGLAADKYFEKHWETIKPSLLKENFVVAHNRLGTGGEAKNNENNHPFAANSRLGKVIVVHNGVLSNHEELRKTEKLRYTGETDSLVIPHLIAKYINGGKTADDAVHECAEAICGSFSVFVSIQDTLYYFKSSSTRFLFGLLEFEDGRKILVGSTCKENAKCLYSYPEMIFFRPSWKSAFWREPAEGLIYNIKRSSISAGKSFKIKPYVYCGKGYEGNKKTINGSVWNPSIQEYDRPNRQGSVIRSLPAIGNAETGSYSNEQAMELANEAYTMATDSEITDIEYQEVLDKAEEMTVQDYTDNTSKDLIKRTINEYWECMCAADAVGTVEEWLEEHAEFWLNDSEMQEWEKDSKSIREKLSVNILKRARSATKCVEPKWISIIDWLPEKERRKWAGENRLNKPGNSEWESRAEYRMRSAHLLDMIDSQLESDKDMEADVAIENAARENARQVS